jgi:hypothetical protein
MGIADAVTNIFRGPIDRFIEGAEDQIVNLPVPPEVRDMLQRLLPILKGQNALNLPSQWTSWQYFTGEAEASKNVLGELLDFVGVTLEDEKGHFTVQSTRHPEHLYKCEFSLGRGGYAYGIPLARILRFLSKALRKLSQAAPWIRMAADALRRGIIQLARANRRLARAIERAEGADVAVERAITEFNKILEGWGSEVPLQNIRRSLLNLQNPTAEMGPPTGLFGPIFVIDIGVTIIGNIKLLLIFMGGPVHWLLGWNPLAYKYIGVNFGYGVQLSADVALNIAYGHVTKITETNSRTGGTRDIPRP